MSLTSIEKLDSIICYLYDRETYMPFEFILNEHFEGDRENNDIDGMLIKLIKDGYIDIGTWLKPGLNDTKELPTYKLSFEGRFLFETAKNNKPYKALQEKERRQKAWEIIKIIAGVLNALLALGVAIWAVLSDKCN